MSNTRDPATEHMTSLIGFAENEGWRLHHLEDGQLELLKPGLPPIRFGMMPRAQISTQRECKDD
jgi:hypothetical protein